MARTINTSNPSASPSTITSESIPQTSATKLAVTVASYYSAINTKNLPKPYHRIPEQCTNLSQTAKYEIQSLQQQLEYDFLEQSEPGYKAAAEAGTGTGGESSSSTRRDSSNSNNSNNRNYNMNEIQDAFDDGFLLCDLNVIQRKLKAWKILFPRIKPFFAIKCNPDCMVSHVLGQTILESNCNSITGTTASASASNDEYNDHVIDKDEKEAKICNCCCGFDCASLAEIQSALQSSHCQTTKTITTTATATATAKYCNSKKCIVYANPQRSIYDLDHALELGVNALTFDSVEELYKVKDAYERLVLKRKEETSISISNTTTCTSSSNDHIIQSPEMIVRIVVPDTHSSIPLGEKFGIEPTYVRQLTEKALELNLDVIGLSFHCGSGNHDPTSYKDAIVIAKSCIDEMNLVLRKHDKDDCCVLDIGGGYPGYDGVGGDFHRFSFNRDNDDDDDMYDDGVGDSKSLSLRMNQKYDSKVETTAYNIAQVVSPLINKLFPTQNNKIDIISEPGRYFVEAAFAYCARIYSVRKTGQIGQPCDGGDSSTNTNSNYRNHYYIAQGVQGLFKDVILCDEIFIPIPLKVDEDGTTRTTEENNEEDRIMTTPSTIHGPSGEDFDIVCKDCMLPELKEGDWLLFDRMGAYTLSIAARNSSLAIRYVL